MTGIGRSALLAVRYIAVGGGGEAVGASGTTFTGTYLQGITLSNPATQNPATLAATGYVTAPSGAAVYGTNAAAWNFTNLGKIASPNGVGMQFQAGGTIDNLGTITGDQLAVVSQGPALVVNGHSGANVGLIESQAPAHAAAGFGTGLHLNAGGTVDNYGTIASGGTSVTGVFVGAASGTILNLGVIAAPGATNSNNAAIRLVAGGYVTNGGKGSSGGTITGGFQGIVIVGGKPTLTNFGYIAAGDAAVVFNSSGGPGSVTNFGTIDGTDPNAGIGVYLNIGGSVTNASGGTITGGQSGVIVAQAAGTVVNSGMVAAVGSRLGNGVNLYNGSTLTNAGAIVAGNYGLYSSGAGAVTNSGTISARFGVRLRGGATIDNTGTITGATAIVLDQGGTVTNGRSGAGIGHIEGQATAGAELAAGTALILGGGLVSNYGTIEANGTNVAGVVMAGGGSIFNLGMIAAPGASTGKNAGIRVGDGGAVTNGEVGSPAGTITGGYAGVVLGSTAELTNYGLITAGGTAVDAAGPAGVIVNNGTIQPTSAAGVGVFLGYAGGSLTNSGTITGSLGSGVVLTGGMIDNAAQGLVSGYRGIVLSGGPGTVVNAGTIVGTGAAAFSFGNGYDLLAAEPGAVFAGSVARFQPLEAIDLAGQPATSVVFVGNTKSGTLTVLNHGTGVATFTLAGHFTTSEFALATDGAGGTDITLKQPGQPVVTGVYYDTVLLGNVAIGASATVVAGGRIDAAFGHGVRAVGGVAGTLINAGTVVATETPQAGVSLSLGDGVYLNAGGVIDNGGGLIAGAVAGVAIGGGDGSIVSTGSIAGTGASGVGVLLGLVTAAAGARAQSYAYFEMLANYGTISGDTGIIAAAGSVTVSNAGMIVGTGGTAVMLAGGDDRLVVDPGAAFQGIADGGGGRSVLELAAVAASPQKYHAAPSVGTLAGIGSSFINFGTLVVDAGAAWEASGDAGFYPTVNNGTIIVADGILGSGETLILGAVGEDAGDTGVIKLGSGGTAEFTGVVDMGQTVLFTDAAGLLQLADSGAFAAHIARFQAGDAIDLLGVAADEFTYAKGKLTLTEAGDTVLILYFDGHHKKYAFQIGSDGGGGTDITLATGADSSPSALLYHPSA